MMHELIIRKGEKRSIVLVHSGSETAERIIHLAGEGAQVTIEEIFLNDAVQSKLAIYHDAPKTFSRVYTRGVVGKGQSILAHAKVVVPKENKECDTFVSQEFLMLDETARVDALPSLEIEADEVKAAHECAVSPLDLNKIFYMMARGLSQQDAKKMVVTGFLRVPIGFEHVVEQWQG